MKTTFQTEKLKGLTQQEVNEKLAGEGCQNFIWHP